MYIKLNLTEEDYAYVDIPFSDFIAVFWGDNDLLGDPEQGKGSLVFIAAPVITNYYSCTETQTDLVLHI